MFFPVHRSITAVRESSTVVVGPFKSEIKLTVESISTSWSRSVPKRRPRRTLPSPTSHFLRLQESRCLVSNKNNNTISTPVPRTGRHDDLLASSYPSQKVFSALELSLCAHVHFHSQRRCARQFSSSIYHFYCLDPIPKLVDEHHRRLSRSIVYNSSCSGSSNSCSSPENLVRSMSMFENVSALNWNSLTCISATQVRARTPRNNPLVTTLTRRKRRLHPQRL